MLPVEFSHTGVVPVMAEVVGSALTVTAKVTVEPTHPAALVSVTSTLPDVEPKVTVMEAVPAPAVMLAPAGTVQA